MLLHWNAIRLIDCRACIGPQLNSYKNFENLSSNIRRTRAYN